MEDALRKAIIDHLEAGVNTSAIGRALGPVFGKKPETIARAALRIQKRGRWVPPEDRSPEFDAGDKFVKCSYCSSQIFIDRSGAGFYYALPFAVSENDAVGMFRRWAGGSTRAKDLDKLAQISSL